MKCHDAQKWFSPYLDSELDQTKTFELSQHLQSCTACAHRFEAERCADKLMVDSLSQGSMPDQLWTRIQDSVTHPSWKQRWLAPRNLALAACLALALTALMMNPRNAVQGHPWLVSELANVTDTATTFPVNSAPPSQAQQDLQTQFGISLDRLTPEVMRPHGEFKLVSVTTRQDQHGQTYYEVRLNCCNHPVLLAISDSKAPSLPAPLADIPVGAFGAGVIVDDTHLSARKAGTFIAAAASTHRVNHLVDMIASTNY